MLAVLSLVEISMLAATLYGHIFLIDLFLSTRSCNLAVVLVYVCTLLINRSHVVPLQSFSDRPLHIAYQFVFVSTCAPHCTILLLKVSYYPSFISFVSYQPFLTNLRGEKETRRSSVGQ